jgi:hypothetical protein
MFSKVLCLALALTGASAFAPGARLPSAAPRAATSTVSMETKSDLVELAGKANPVVKFFDPLGLSEQNFWGTDEAATIGFLRHAEIKHGRIAMFAFCGFIAQSNGVRFPWAMTLDGSPFPEAGGVPGAQWDAIPSAAKWQIVCFAAIMELWSEGAMKNHYMKGGKAGEFPSFKDSEISLPHSVPFDLFDPFGLSKKASAEKKAAGLVKEINNGRLAMIGIFGFLAESKVDGAVPALTGKIAHYDGDYMAPFEANFHLFN